MVARPNILLITCHDLGDHLSSYGWHTVQSPALEALAAWGVQFTNSFCTAPQCSPSRASLHTGRYAHANGMMGLAHAPFSWRLHKDELHLAQILRANGYETALRGVQHLTDSPTELGYDTVITRRPANELADEACTFLNAPEHRERPFYLEIGFFEPHRPYNYGDAQPDSTLGVQLPAYIPEVPESREDFAALQGAVREMDRAVAKIIESLEKTSLLESTWLIFTTDHGIAMPRAKCTCYDPGIRTALMMLFPAGGIAGGRRIDALVSHVDMVPTILEALELPIDSRLHGRSYWSLLQGQASVHNMEIFAEKTFHTAYEPMRCIRTTTHKLIVNFEIDLSINVPGDIQLSPIYPLMLDEIARTRKPVELYDLIRDPNETTNLAGTPELEEIEHDLKAKLLGWMESTDDPLLQGPIASPYYKAALTVLQHPK